MIEVQTHNDGGNIDVNGTCLQGYVHGPGQQLVEKFGEPLLGWAQDKVEYEWNLYIESDSGYVPVTIYSWKNYGEKSFDQLRVWHVGGKNKQVLELLRKLDLTWSVSAAAFGRWCSNATQGSAWDDSKARP
jgi:hypothetical protein